ncbi:MAG: DUF512 domain-containing protein [Candidatus Eisenbacteria bacterium]
MVQVETVAPGSEAELLGIRPGDQIVRINGEPVRDALDFHFRAADLDLSIELFRGTEKIAVDVSPMGPPDLGISLAPMKVRLCGNDCVFCFTYQNPSGMRKTLYVKDEDYRLSFLHGNFVTLSNLKEWEIRRIVEQKLSPIYVSVHSMDPAVRQEMIRARQDRDIRPILDYFAENDIEMHTQVVFVPGYNDGEDLKNTVRELAKYFPHVQSLAVVPLGMTTHREGLPDLEPVSEDLARRTLADAEAFQEEFRETLGITFLHMADEWYRKVGRPVPPETQYDGFPQLENGIGLTRWFTNKMGRVRQLFPDAKDAGVRKVTLVTGELFRPVLEPMVRKKLERSKEDVEVQIVGVENHFFGRSITVSGLLVGQDIIRALEQVPDLGDRIYLPPSTLNDDDIFLDDTPLGAIQERFRIPVQVGFRDRIW